MREMKDSGVEWIGEIPITWNLSKIGSKYEERNIKVSDKDYQPLSVTKNGIVPQLENAAKTDNGDNRKLIKKNDFVINSRSDRRGSCGISELEGSCSLINTVLKPRENMNNRYYGFVFKSDNFADEFYRWGHGIVNDLWSTKWSDMKSIYIPSPTIDEQQRIADYLDKKCSKIDEIIEKQQAIIEKLKEYKLSVITETVTKGLNPNVEMKDSGIEWMGKIPCEWKTSKIIQIGKTSSGSTPSRSKDEEYYLEEAIIPWVRTLDLNEGFIYESLEKISSTALEKSSCKIMPINTVCVAMYGGSGTIGKCGMLKIESTTNQAICSIVCNDKMIPQYLLYQMIAMRKYWMKYAVGTRKDPNISQDIVCKMRILVPVKDEQSAIVDYLDAFKQNIDTRIDKGIGIIEKLIDYKKSLIYELVTGKKEV